MRAILNCDINWGIGRKNGLLFNLPADMAFFRKTTMNKVVVMGYNTLLSFPGSKPLKNRTNIVLWADGNEEKATEQGFILAKNLNQLFEAVGIYNPDDVFVIGGATVYHTLLPYCSEVLITKVFADGKAEVFFDNLDQLSNWTLKSGSDRITDNGYETEYRVYINNKIKKYLPV